MIRSVHLAVLVAAPLVALLAPARADMVVDQANPLPGGAILGGPADGPFGQSFTPTFSGIDFATFSAFSNSTTALEVMLYAGSGYGGQLLATSDTQTFTSTVFLQTTTLEFHFASRIALTPGTQYTLKLQRVSGDGFSPVFSLNNTYSGGQEIGSPNQDLDFSEGIIVASAVPEPSSLALCGIAGVMGLARWDRRQFKGVA